MLISSSGGKNFHSKLNGSVPKATVNKWESASRTVSQDFVPRASLLVPGVQMGSCFYIREGKKLSELKLFQSHPGKSSALQEKSQWFAFNKEKWNLLLIQPPFDTTPCPVMWMSWGNVAQGRRVLLSGSAKVLGKSSFDSRLLWVGQAELRWNYPEKWGKSSRGNKKEKIINKEFL